MVMRMPQSGQSNTTYGELHPFKLMELIGLVAGLISDLRYAGAQQGIGGRGELEKLVECTSALD
jgi:hypothetical protein